MSITGLVDSMRAGHQRPVPLMERVLMQPDGPNSYLVWHAWQPGEVVVTKMGTIFPGNTDLPSVQALVMVFDGTTGEPVAIIDGTELTYWKTAASSLTAASMLARPDSRSLLVIGAGGLAAHFINGYRAMFPLDDVRIWNRTAAKAAAVAARSGATVVDDLDAAQADADIITCLTASTTPLVRGAVVKPGCHVDLVGGYTPTMRESDDDLVRRALVTVDAPMYNIDACGDLCQPIAAGVITRDDVVADLYALCSGAHPGRSAADQVTLYKSGGGAHLDLMAAQYVLSLG
jgi:ornithine cyclodeaminase/alanine dehydrogenase-like protein (mu-crystallin family)